MVKGLVTAHCRHVRHYRRIIGMKYWNITHLCKWISFLITIRDKRYSLCICLQTCPVFLLVKLTQCMRYWITHSACTRNVNNNRMLEHPLVSLTRRQFPLVGLPRRQFPLVSFPAPLVSSGESYPSSAFACGSPQSLVSIGESYLSLVSVNESYPSSVSSGESYPSSVFVG